MAASSAVSGFSTLLKRGSTATVEVVSVAGPDVGADPIDVTHLTSDSGFKEFISGLKDGGTLTAVINYLPQGATHIAFLTDLAAGTKTTWSIVFNGTSGYTWTFTAMVIKFTPNAQKDDKLSATVQLRVSGAPTFPS